MLSDINHCAGRTVNEIKIVNEIKMEWINGIKSLSVNAT